MRIAFRILAIAFSLLIFNCGREESKEKEARNEARLKAVSKQSETPAEDAVPASKRITLDEKGVGQIKNISLDAEVNTEMALAGAALFKTNCSACHKIDKRFIGPSPKGILERRSPEWIMNMILDPKLMTEQDRCAKDLLIEFNGAAMANQNLTVEQTRSILEYFRTL